MPNCQVLIEKLLQIKQSIYLLKKQLKKLEIFDSSYFRDKSHFGDDGTQNYLLFQIVYRYFKTVSGNILSWQSKGLSDENSKPSTISNKVLNPLVVYVGTQIRVKFNGHCLKQEKVAFNQVKIVNIYIVYEIESSVNINSYPTLENFLLGAVKLTKHVEVDPYKYSGYGIGFDRKGS